jgi:hypothetical protein
VGVLATISGGQMKLRAQVFEGDSVAPREAEVQGASSKCDVLAAELSRMIE